MIDELLAKLDLDTKAALLAGQDTWSLPAAPEIGLASLVMSDGPIGVRGTLWRGTDPSIALPSPTAMAATWDPDLIRRAGNLLAAEARRKGVHVLLAPTVNLHRTPLGGRHFECFSEDPLLTALIGAAYVVGVQDGGVGATVKHFVAGDSETDRMTVDVQVSERALRELYLAPFEHIVTTARPQAIMAAYNGVNGSTMTEHAELLEGVLRGEWGFDGPVISDWFAARDTVRAVLGGLGVAMPGPVTVYGRALADAVRDGEVPEAVVDEHVRRVLELATRVGALGPPPENAPPSGDLPAPDGPAAGLASPDTHGLASDVATADPHGPTTAVAAVGSDGPALARELAARSMVLLRNHEVLPLASGTRIALLGALAADARVMGGGSAQVYPAHVVSPLEGLLTAGTDVTYARGAEASSRFQPAAAGFALTATVRDATGRIRAELPLPDGAIAWMGEMPAGLGTTDVHSVEITGTFTAQTSGGHRFGIEGAGPFRLTVDGQVLFDDELPMADISDLVGAIFRPLQHEIPLDLQAGQRIALSLLHTAPPFLSGQFPAVSFTLGHRSPDTVRDPDDLLSEAERVAAAADLAVVVVGTSKEVESEGFDRRSLKLPGRQDELVTRVAAANPRTIVLVNAGAPVEMPWRDEVAAILLTWFSGQEGGHALADVLTGQTEPCGRLPTTWPASLGDCPVTRVTPENGSLPYDEDVFIGYRAWERSPIPPAFAFGSGQGYTTWAYEDAARDGQRVTVRLRNTGHRPGREVVQAYLRPGTAGPTLPKRWLAGFAIADAEPGATTEVTIDIPDRAYQTWTEHGWQPIPGPIAIEIAHSLTDTKITLS